MTSRERVLSTLQGKTVDRLAFDFRAEVEVFQVLQRHFSLSSIEDVLVRVKSDFRDLSFLRNSGGYGGYSCFGWKDRKLDDGTFEDMWGVKRRLANYGQGSYMDIVYSPLRGVQGMDALRKYAFPDPRPIYDFSPIPGAVKELNRENEYFFLMEGESLFDRSWALRGIDDFFADLMTDEDSARHVITANFRFMYEFTRMLLEKADGCVDAIGMYDDFGNQRQLMISPALYRKYFKDLQKEYIDMVKGFGAKVFFHSCGAVTEIVPDLVEIGIDILDPLQFSAMQVTPEKLTKICGDRITYHGGVDIQNLFVKGTPREVQDCVRNLRRTLGRHGRYILACSHLIQMDAPIANIEALVDMVN
jgi:uroporphyrinogen decarboxylase